MKRLDIKYTHTVGHPITDSDFRNYRDSYKSRYARYITEDIRYRLLSDFIKKELYTRTETESAAEGIVQPVRSFIIQLGGPFEEVGGSYEATGGDDTQMG